jgi:FixJ family two-component response regulator
LAGASLNRGASLPQSPKQILIFVVDDEFVIASTLALILIHKGFEAISFSAPGEALEAARSRAPDLLITDVVMPHFSGVDLAIRIQEQCPNCKVLLFSGQAATAASLLTAKERGQNFDIMSKPVHPMDLLRKIAEATADIPGLAPVG